MQLPHGQAVGPYYNPKQRQVFKPNPGPQEEFLACPLFEALFGGAAGGGKSWALLLDFARDADNPFSNGIIFRRNIGDLEDLIRKSKQIYYALYPKAKFNEQKRKWTFPSGATLYMSFIECDKDLDKYYGQEYSWIGFDELGQFTYNQYIFMFTRCRSSQPGMRCRVRATTNPGGIGHSWIKARFIDACREGRKIIRDKPGGLPRIFFPAKVTDNPKLLENDPDYLKRFAGLDERLQRALLEGDWDALGGDFFQCFKASTHVIDWNRFMYLYNLKSPEIPNDWPKFRAFDYGYSHPFACLWCTFDPHGRIIIYREYYGCPDPKKKPDVGSKMDAISVAKGILARERPGENILFGVADPSMWGVRDPNGVNWPDYHSREGVNWEQAVNDRKVGWQVMLQMMQLEECGKTPDGKRKIYRPNFYVFNTCTQWLRTVPTLPSCTKDPDDVDTKAEDHLADATRYACMVYPIPHSSQWTDEEKEIRHRRGTWMSR